MLTAIRNALPGPRRLARQAGLLLGISVLIGAFLFHVWTGLGQLSERWPTLLWNVYFTLVHATIIVASVRAAMYVLRTSVPLQSRRAVALHVGTLSVVTVVAFGTATGLCKALHPGFDLSWEVLLTSATTASAATLIWSAFSYMSAFYQRLREAEEARYEARLSALRAQINPHFLFNAFNSIAALVRTRPGEAEAVVEDLSDLFRYALRASKDGGTATLEDELEAACRYLSVEKARYRGRLTVEIRVPEQLRPLPIPSMTLQPLVENAVQHGVGETQGDCTVSVTAERADGTLLLRVLDTGPGFDSTDLGDMLGEGSGLANVRERLELFFGEAAQMRLLPQGIELQIPLRGTAETRPRSAVEEHAFGSDEHAFGMTEAE
ncbi:sensor histidine kinase [Salinibacter ruber]|uniref:sensor histidine kinase n=1 Tax=Salinibacter ruber TaxID=146919 RepID=UPI0020734C17|nr:histidine kinase [Salinibacter ruber]